jgi:beta-galactosidase
MKLGVCYYPEHWPQERWPIDARLMRQAGLSVVRIADFAWSIMEPREGEFTWEWLDQAIEVLAAEALEIVLCTPTASPPPWLCRANPEILPVDVQGRRRRYGARRHYCANSEIYRQHTARIVKAMASRYGKHPAVAGWQIDNEFGCHFTARCYCETCAAAFRLWLEEKYENIDGLNRAWGTVFWSQIYGNWSEIDPPNLTIFDPNPSHVLDYYRFSSDTYFTYLELQLATLQPLASESQIVTTNFMSQFSDLNYHKLAGPLDRVTMSSYPTGHAENISYLYMPSGDRAAFAYDVGDPYATALGHTLMRGFKPGRPFWVMEQQAGSINWSAYNSGIRPGTIRLWTWQALASGAEAVLYFRWRAGLYAQEQMHSGLLNHDGSPGVGYNDLKMMQSERARMAEIASEHYEAKIAILLDYDALWALQLQPHNRDFDYMRHLFVYYHALQRLGLPADIVSADADFSPYKMVIAPNAFLATEPQAASLKLFAEAGGTVLLGVRSGFKTVDNQVTDHPLPGIFRELVAVTVSDWHSLPPGIGYDLVSSIPDLAGAATVWAETLVPSTGDSRSANPNLKTLANYRSGPFTPHAALCENEVGAGRALYMGWYPSDAQAKALLAHLANEAGIRPLAQLPDGMVAAQRGRHLILLNFADETLEATVRGKAVTVASRAVEVISKHDS